MADGEIALPFHVARVAPRQHCGDAKSGLVAGERARQIALCAQHIADLVVADGEIALVARRSGGDHGLIVGRKSLRQGAMRPENVAKFEPVEGILRVQFYSLRKRLHRLFMPEGNCQHVCFL